MKRRYRMKSRCGQKGHVLKEQGRRLLSGLSQIELIVCLLVLISQDGECTILYYCIVQLIVIVHVIYKKYSFVLSGTRFPVDLARSC